MCIRGHPAPVHLRLVFVPSSPVNGGPGGGRLRAPLGARRSRPPAILWWLSDRSESHSPPPRRNIPLKLNIRPPKGTNGPGAQGAARPPAPKFSSPVTFWTQYYGYVTLAPNPLTSRGGSDKITVRQGELYRANCPQMFPFTPFSGPFGPISAQIVDTWFLRDSGAWNN